MDPSTASYANRPVSPVRPRWQPPAIERPQLFVRPEPVITPTPVPVEQVVTPEPMAVPIESAKPIDNLLSEPLPAITAPVPLGVPLSTQTPSSTPVSQPTFYAPPAVKPSVNQIYNHPVSAPQKWARSKAVARRVLQAARRYRKPLLIGAATLGVILVVFSGVKLAGFVASSHRTAQSNARNATRVADLTSLQSNLENFYSKHHDYPTYAQLNEADFRQNNLPNIATSKLKDPASTSTNLAAKPTKDNYSYQVLPAGCDNSHVKCNEYEVAAVLDNGTPISKMNPVH